MCLNRKTLANLAYSALCLVTVLVSCFDCVVSLITTEALEGGSELNPVWAGFLEMSTVRTMVMLKFAGIFGAAGIMYVVRNHRYRMTVMVPVAAAHVFLFMVLNFGAGMPGYTGMFYFDFSDPFELTLRVVDAILAQTQGLPHGN